MLQLLNPIWLFGISGILVPLIIHLWNIKTGKTLKVGSIRLMGESSRQNSRSLKLMDLLLLFLRCLVIILLSLYLAEPVWKSLQAPKGNKAWILIEKSAFAETYTRFKGEIDSLSAAGEELRLFEPGFKRVELEEMLADSTKADSSALLPYWSLLRLLEQQIPQGSKALIYTSDRANRFKGARPAISTAINWKAFTPADSISKWIDRSYLTISGEIKTIVSESSPSGTFNSAIDIAPGNEISGVRASILNGKAQVQLDGQTLLADTSTLTIAVNVEGFQNDAAYLGAAIASIQKYTSRKIKLVKPSSQQDILFWLSSKELPSGIKANTKVFKYAMGKVTSTNTWLKFTEGLTTLKTENIRVYKRISYPEKALGFSVWEDGFGKPLLDLKQSNNVSLYTFYSRLNPEWTDLVWSPEFVKLLMPLILPAKPDAPNGVFDKRSIHLSQILPHSDLRPPTSELRPQTSDNPVTNKKDLQHFIWILLMGIFIAERYLSFRTSTN
ncbi:BatA domain-containing protein [Daejeonella sp.]|uniref:BatA domain-containing protein n=1 Tax=Daejeonella sp. TaxID=2805397 RepID=UPI0039834840